jgi:hypothetical protein
MSESHFHIEIYAPSGLSGIEPYLVACKLPLEPWASGFNGQVILRYAGSDDTDFAMDPSTTETLHASGYMREDPMEAWKLLESLSKALSDAGFPHVIGMDDDTTKRSFWIHHKVKSSGVSQIAYEA